MLGNNKGPRKGEKREANYSESDLDDFDYDMTQDVGN